MVKWGVVAASFGLLGVACKPNLDDTLSIVNSPRVLAVRVGSEGGQAEAAPMGVLQFTALYVDGSGPIASPAIDWALCNERKPLAELEPVSPLCLYASGDWFIPLGMGNPVTGSIPNVACRQFGPDVPQPLPKQPPGRPVDPDITGGYYQPVRVLARGAGSNIVAIAETRLSCGLAGAPPDLSEAFTQRYHPNTNPLVAALGVKGGSTWAPASAGGSNPVRVGERLELEVSWEACPQVDMPADNVCGPDETGGSCMTCGPNVAMSPADCCPAADCAHPKGCTGAERYVRFDPQSANLVDQREGIAVSWFATAGAFDADATGRGSTEPESASDNGWLAPSAPREAILWVVLRDDRGGIGWQTYLVSVH